MDGEFERIAEIRRRLGATGAELDVDNGDDAVVLRADAAPQVLSVDCAIEGVHFRRDLMSAQDIGYRALCAAASDLAAMGATPRGALVALIAPRALEDAFLYAIADGFAEAQRALATPVIGGNLSLGGELSITTTVIGRAPDGVLTRAGARPGDGLFVTGVPGLAGLGLQALLAGHAELAPAAIARYRRPHPRLRAGRALAAVASACIDVSDGLLGDLAHLVEASGVGFEIELEALPRAAEADALERALGLDARALALTAGDDYELLFTAAQPPPELPVPVTRIGRAVAAPGLRLLDANGAEVLPPGRTGFDHFG